jgi:hypothetical protein
MRPFAKDKPGVTGKASRPAMEEAFLEVTRHQEFRFSGGELYGYEVGDELMWRRPSSGRRTP